LREQDIQSKIMLALSEAGSLIFRNNTGTGWVGRAERITSHRYAKVAPGDVVVRAARPLHAGLCVGSSDLIGVTPVTVTPDMVGSTIGVFTAAEVKSKTGRPTKEQSNFINRISSAGGFAGIARSPDDALLLVSRV